ncbi:hypothetical protein ACVILK_003421 [Bradyrhizobium embrapense]
MNDVVLLSIIIIIAGLGKQRSHWQSSSARAACSRCFFASAFVERGGVVLKAGRVMAHHTQDPKDAIEHATVIYALKVARLVWQHRFGGVHS